MNKWFWLDVAQWVVFLPLNGFLCWLNWQQHSYGAAGISFTGVLIVLWYTRDLPPYLITRLCVWWLKRRIEKDLERFKK